MNRLPIYILLSYACLISGSDIGHFIQITDIHYDSNYQIGSPNNCVYGSKTDVKCCHDLDIPLEPFEAAMEFGDLKCNTPLRLAEITFEYIRDDVMSEYEIDFMIWNGDSSAPNLVYDQTSKFNNINKITQMIKDYLPVLRVFPVVGENDIERSLKNTAEKDTQLKKLYSLWEDWLPNGYNNFIKHGYYIEKVNDITFIVINKMYYDIFSNYNMTNDPLTNEIETARCNNETVWLIGHTHPHNSNNLMYIEYMYDLIDKYNDTIVNQFWGSSHHSDHILYSYNGIDKAMGYVVGSILPDEHFPEFRIYSYDRKTNEIINFDQYALNITALNNGIDVKYEKIYDAKTEYGINDLSIASWSNLTDCLKNDDEIFNKWYNNYHYGVNQKCDDEWKKIHICNIKYLDLYDNLKCCME